MTDAEGGSEEPITASEEAVGMATTTEVQRNSTKLLRKNIKSDVPN